MRSAFRPATGPVAHTGVHTGDADDADALGPSATTDRATLLLACALADQPMAWPADLTRTAPDDSTAPRRPRAGVLCLPPAQGAAADARAHRRVALLRQAIAHQPGGHWPLLADTLAPALAQTPRPLLLRRLFDRLEARRVDAVLARQYPGARADLARVQQRHPARGLWAPRLAALADANPQLLGLQATAVDSLQAAQDHCAALIAAHGAGRRAAAATSGAWLRPQAPDGADAASSTCESQGRPAASAWGDAPAEASRTRPTDDQPRPDTPGRPPVAASPGQPKPDSPPAAAQNPSQLPAHAPDEQPPDTVGRPRPAHALPGTTQHWYDEWDMTLQRYRRAWTCVQVQPAPAGDLAYLAGLHQRHAALRRAIRRQFAATPPLARERGGPAADGDQIDFDQALAHLVDRRAGGQAEARPYRHRPRARRDVCTAVLLDMSGSTGFAVPPRAATGGAAGATDRLPAAQSDDDDDDLLYGFRPRTGPPAPPPRRVIDIARDAIALVCDGMALLGDRHAVWGFSGQGRLRVDLRLAKAFDAPWNRHSAAALAALQPQGSTRTGAAIRHAVAQLRQQPERTRVLIVVTDGYPQDQDYGPDPRDRRYGLHDTAVALREAERAGIAAFCVSVDQAAHDYLRGVCPPQRYLVIDDVHRLPAQLARLYRRLTSV